MFGANTTVGFGAASPQTGGFGAAAAPQVGGFGATAAPQTGGFGATAAPQTGGFGGTAAPQTGGFGATAAPQTGGFGAAAPIGLGVGSQVPGVVPASGDFGKATSTNAASVSPAANGFSFGKGTAPAASGASAVGVPTAPSTTNLGPAPAIGATKTPAPAPPAESGFSFVKTAMPVTPATDGFGAAAVPSTKNASAIPALSATTAIPASVTPTLTSAAPPAAAVLTFGTTTTTSATPALPGFGTAPAVSVAAPAAKKLGFAAATGGGEATPVVATASAATGTSAGAAFGAAPETTASGTAATTTSVSSDTATKEFAGKVLSSILSCFDRTYFEDQKDFREVSRHIIARDRQLVDRKTELVGTSYIIRDALASARATSAALKECSERQASIARLLQDVEDAVNPIVTQVEEKLSPEDCVRMTAFEKAIALYDEVQSIQHKTDGAMNQLRRVREQRHCDDVDRVIDLATSQLSALEACSVLAKSLEEELDKLLGKTT